MKTAISIPDDVYEAAEQLAKRAGMSRSELYAKAVHAYVAARRGEGVTEALDRVYGETPSGLDRRLMKLQAASLPREKW